MKRIATLIALAIAATGMTPAQATDEVQVPGDVVFQVRIEPKRGGRVLCALYKNEKNWLTHTTFRGSSTEASEQWATCRFGSVPGGKYAIAALHDEDRDGEMDKFLGLPLEGYAASRDAHFKGIGAPDWEDALFHHDGSITFQRARMKY